MSYGCLYFLAPRRGTLGWSMICDCGISGLEVIKLEFVLKLKIKRNDCLLADTCHGHLFLCVCVFFSVAVYFLLLFFVVVGFGQGYHYQPR